MRSARWLGVVAAVLARPVLWPAAVRLVVRMAPRGWWRRRPWLPLPDRAYLRFRLVTAFGPESTPQPAEVVSYLQWCRAWPQVVRG